MVETTDISYFCNKYEDIYNAKLCVPKSAKQMFLETTQYNNKNTKQLIDIYFDLFKHECKPFEGNTPSMWHFCHERNQG